MKTFPWPAWHAKWGKGKGAEKCEEEGEGFFLSHFLLTALFIAALHPLSLPFHTAAQAKLFKFKDLNSIS